MVPMKKNGIWADYVLPKEYITLEEIHICIIAIRLYCGQDWWQQEEK